MSRRGRLALGLTAILTLLSAACGRAGPQGDQEAVLDGRGLIEIGPEDPIKIAAIQAISGDVASVGQDQVRAIEIAIADRGQIFEPEELGEGAP